MGSEWKSIRFGELYEYPSRNGLMKPKRVRGEGFKFINMGEIFAHDRMLNIPCDRVPLTDKEEKSSLVEAGDLLFARQSLTLDGAGKCSIFLGDDEPVSYESHLIRVRLDRSRVDPKFLYYFFKSPNGKAEMWTIVEQGAGQAGIRGSDLENLNIPLPDYGYQNKVALIFSSLDDKIELNRQTNKTLEKMAQALFKSWFVDFDPVIDNALAAGNTIPDELQDRAERRQQQLAKPDHQPLPDDIRQLFPGEFELTEALGWVPMGWEVKQIKDFGEVVCGKTPSKKNADNFNGDIPFIKIPDMHGKVYPIRTTDTLSKLGAISQPKKEIPAGSVCVSSIATVGKVVIAPYASHTNQQINSVVPSIPKLTPYIYFSMLEIEGKLHDLASGGSATLNMNTSTFSKMKILRPDENAMLEFFSRVDSFFLKILNNEKSNLSLSRLRDTLLPKLISGELRLPSDALADAEQQLADAAS